MALSPGQSPRNSRGRPYQLLATRPLTEGDLPALREKAAPMARLQTLRDSHHRVARLMASGLSNVQIATSCGHSLQALVRYRSDPAMQELVAHYRALCTEEWLSAQDEFTSLAISNMVKAERMLSDKLDEADENGDSLPTPHLLSISGDRMDRFGFPKRSQQTNVNVNYAAELEAAIARSRTKTIEAE